MITARIAFVPTEFCGLKPGNPERIMLLLRDDGRCKAVHTIGTLADMEAMSPRYRARYIPQCSTH